MKKLLLVFFMVAISCSEDPIEQIMEDCLTTQLLSVDVDLCNGSPGMIYVEVSRPDKNKDLVFFYNNESVVSQQAGEGQYFLEIDNPVAIAFLEIRYSETCVISRLVDLVTEFPDTPGYTEIGCIVGTFEERPTVYFENETCKCPNASPGDSAMISGTNSKTRNSFFIVLDIT